LSDRLVAIRTAPRGFRRYQRAGVNVGIGTNTVPQTMIEEMRAAATFSRIAAENVFTATTEDVFTAATIGSAKALLRKDLGRLAVGMKADIVLVDMETPSMRPARDPLRSLIYSAADRAVTQCHLNLVQQRKAESASSTAASARNRNRMTASIKRGAIATEVVRRVGVDQASPIVRGSQWPFRRFRPAFDQAAIAVSKAL
jgi:5-methylthioadenosine/S-adenosylhomocysteine deaminase